MIIKKKNNIIQMKYKSQNPGMLTNDQGAVALVLVVWVVVVLMAIVGEFAYSMRTEINITKNFKEEEIAYQLAMAGIEQAKLEILSTKSSDVTYLDEEAKLAFKDQEDEEEVISRSGELGAGSFEYTITDEDSKINVNTASLEQLKYLLDSTGVESEDVDVIADSIFDWRDPNDLHLLNGAEEDYYNSLDEPYSSKDAPLEAIEELLLVKGMTPEILYGTTGEEEEDSYEGVMKYLTVYNTGIVNINTATERVLEIVFGLQEANNILTLREMDPIRSPRSRGKVSSSYFTVISTGVNTDGKIKRTIKTVFEKNNRDLEIVYWNDNII